VVLSYLRQWDTVPENKKIKRKLMSGVRIELTIFGLLPLSGSHSRTMRPTLYQLSQPDLNTICTEITLVSSTGI
jgi:hypothetical protein